MTEQGAAGFSILTVCTGNLARSPLSAQLLAARLRSLPAVAVSSAGTGARAGDSMTTQAANLSLQYGGDPENHRARYLAELHVSDADLVLTATRQHRAAVVTLVPRAARYAFTLRQFARLVDSLDLGEVVPADVDGKPTELDWLRALVATAAAHRGFLPPLADPADDDIEDPFLQSQAVYDRVGALIDHDVAVISDALLQLGRKAQNS